MTETQSRYTSYPGLYKATYYVDSSFTGLQAGSCCNPFTTVAAAFAAAALQGVTKGVIYIPPGATHVENIVFPTVGSWELTSPGGAGWSGNTTILNGTVTLTSTVRVAHTISNIAILGAVSGDNSATGVVNRLFLRLCELNTSLNLTATGSGSSWLVYLDGGSPYTVGGNFTGLPFGIFALCSIAGSLFAFACNIADTFTVSGDSQFVCVYFNGLAAPLANTNAPGLVNLTFIDCVFKNPATITALTGTVSAQFDAASWAYATRANIGLAAGAGCTFKTLNSNQSSITLETNNRGSTAFGARMPDGLYEVVFSATLLSQGSAGLLQLSVTYTDMTGTLVTVAMAGNLDVTAAVGTKYSGVSLPFHHNGGVNPIAFFTSGIVTPGAMSVSLAVALRQVN